MLKRRFDIICSSLCEKGDIREVNQDAVLVRYGEVAGHTAGLFVVADGCGGLSHGDRISRMITERCEELWDEQMESFVRNPSENSIRASVLERIDDINEAARDYGRQKGSRVGSTMSLLLLIGRRYYIFHVGDSRIYLHRRKKSLRLTEDQTFLEDRLRNREMTVEEAMDFRGKNPLTMCVGYFDPVRVFTSSGTARRDDIFLMCSDGFYNGLGGAFFGKVFPSGVTEDSAFFLRRMIPENQAGDNVSIIIFQLK